ncbi:MAG: hypothetical protein ACO3JL_11610 [Myxococcota bacterium]
MSQGFREWRGRKSLWCAGLVVLGGCATTGQAPTRAEAQESSTGDVTAGQLCSTLASVEEARARGTLGTLRASFEERLAVSPLDRSARFGQIATISDEQQRWKAFREDRKANPESVVGALGECLVYADWKMSDQAKRPCEAAAKAVPGLALVEVAYGDIDAKRGDRGSAKGHYEAAIQLDGSCASTYPRLAAVLAPDDVAKAVAAYDDGLKVSPGCFTCAVGKAELIEREQGSGAALAAWEAALALAPEHPSTVKRYAAAQAGRDDGAAFAAYEKAIMLGVDDIPTLVAASELATKLGRADRALAHAKSAAAMKSDDVSNWRLVAQCAEASADAATARDAYQQVLRLLPSDVSAHLSLGRGSRASGDYVDALAHYEAAMAAGASPEPSTTAELESLLKELHIKPEGHRGDVNRVVRAVQGEVRLAFQEQRESNPALTGIVQVTVITAPDGSVKEVQVGTDELQNPVVSASLVGNFQRANITGGAKRYRFELEFR